MDVQKLVEGLLVILSVYFKYLYPGFISLYVYRYCKSEDFEENAISTIKCIVISFLYVKIWNLIVFRFPILTIIQEWIVYVTAAVIVPYLVWKFRGSSLYYGLLNILGIPTNIHDNPLSIALEKEDSLWICAYMDDYETMYEGWLRNHTEDIGKEKYIMISDYRISKLDSNKVYKQTYPEIDMDDRKKHAHSCDWAILQVSKITRIEIVFEKEW